MTNDHAVQLEFHDGAAYTAAGQCRALSGRTPPCLRPRCERHERGQPGIKFTSSSNGWITGIRFYKGPNNTGTHVGSLWSSSGTLLGQVTFTNESTAGWEQAKFATPIAVTAGTTYVASYLAPGGEYAVAAKGCRREQIAADGVSIGRRLHLRHVVSSPENVQRGQLLGRRGIQHTA